ncbi:MAG: portal protein, partial [Candidatus Poribacteria bacterium]|nr:portal protein [Candidatus Poribacteria bacterium]
SVTNQHRYKQEDSVTKEELENYEVAHFRLLSDSNYLPYGKSQVEGARKIWKQLTLMEDAMLIHRIMRAPEKRIFKLDIGNIPPTEVDNYMQKVINKMKEIFILHCSSFGYIPYINLLNQILI